MTYQEAYDENNKLISIYKEGVGHIPTDPANSDYQRYLRWLENPEAEQSTPSVTNGD
jgi:hypothetical protein